ncbi:hypothetical protein Q7P37_009527 [Cladosporium fusiforme]
MPTSSWDNSWAAWSFSPSISAILFTLLVSILSPILLHYYLYRKSAPKQLPTVLLLGPSGGGKTTLLTSFSNGTPSVTHTSQAPQTALCQLPANHTSYEDRLRSENDNAPRWQPKFLLLDTPGHGKLRHHAISALKTSTALKGLLFVVDSAAVSSAAGLTEAAEYLHEVLLLLQKRHTQGKTSRSQATPVLVAANKQDVFTSLPAGIVKSKLEDEITKVRVTRSKGLMDSGVGMEDDVGGGVDEEQNWLGEFGSKQFRFAQMEEHGVEVSVVGGNVKGEGGKAGSVGEWWAWVGNNL